MKILIVTPNFYPYIGGLEEQCYLLAREFINLGYSVDIVTEKYDSYLKSIEVVDGINIIRTSYLNNRRNLVSFFKLCCDYIKILKKYKYDFVIIRTLTFPAIFFGLLKAIKFLRSVSVVSMETGDVDDLCLLRSSHFFTIYKFFLSKHDFLNSVCEINYLNYINAGFNKSKLVKIVNGVEVEPYKKCKYPHKVVNFLFLGRLVKEKGLYELLEAFRKLNMEFYDIRLIIGGDGKEKKIVKSYIKKNKLTKSIKMLGKIERNDKVNFFNMGDCLVSPSYSEGFGMVIYEAAIYKKMIISTNVADICKVFRNRALYVNKKDSNDLYLKMKSLCTLEKIYPLNYDDIYQNFSISNTAQSYLSLIIRD